LHRAAIATSDRLFTSSQNMKKPKRTRRARNKIEGSSQGALIKADPFLESVIEVPRTSAVWVARQTLFTAELEEAIEVIARERVYRALLDRLGRRLLVRPATSGDIIDA
jgi:hypothetical protein